MQDAIYNDFSFVAKHSFKGLILPKEISNAFLHPNKAKYKCVETKLYWNDKEFTF